MRPLASGVKMAPDKVKECIQGLKEQSREREEGRKGGRGGEGRNREIVF